MQLYAEGVYSWDETETVRGVSQMWRWRAAEKDWSFNARCEQAYIRISASYCIGLLLASNYRCNGRVVSLLVRWLVLIRLFLLSVVSQVVAVALSSAL